MPEPAAIPLTVVDAANVVGSRPNGWWRDRPGAARDLVAGIVAAVAAGALEPDVVVVLEGRARPGATVGSAGPGVAVVHAPHSGDDEIVRQVAAASTSPFASSPPTAPSPTVSAPTAPPSSAPPGSSTASPHDSGVIDAAVTGTTDAERARRVRRRGWRRGGRCSRLA